MIKIKSLEEFDSEKINIDAFWNIGDEKELKMHRIHSYPAKFPSFITTKALDYARKNNLNPNVIADIFCGCGTTAFESKRNDIDFWGCDINPVATLIARTKSKKYQSKRLQGYYEKIVSSLNSSKVSNFYDDGNERLKYWYTEEQFNDLALLKKIIEEEIPAKSVYLDFFLCAFSNILKSTSMWLTKSIKPQYDPEKKPVKVLSAFKKQYKFMFQANKEITKFKKTDTTIVNDNFLQTVSQIPEIDMIITSPPYVTSYEYADLHQLSTLWLEYTDDYKTLRDGTIGSLYHDYNFNREFKRLNSTGYKIVSLLLDTHKTKSRSVAKYFLDMQKVAEKSYKILSPNGIALFVIGNTEYKNIKIDNAKHLTEALLDSGFAEVHATKRKISNKILTPYRDKNGKFTTNSNGRKIYSEEFIIIGRK